MSGPLGGGGFFLTHTVYTVKLILIAYIVALIMCLCVHATESPAATAAPLSNIASRDETCSTNTGIRLSALDLLNTSMNHYITYVYCKLWGFETIKWRRRLMPIIKRVATIN